jgi:hypothetical protein
MKTQTACTDTEILGPFLTIILTSAERKVEEQPYRLHSSIVPANSA